ncbi:uncharacterized protein LOC111805576 [Cucurbita pepo subsp. pepo]|uniref:uncharacterized protein LOC111805576 n=1 Tax=Cucurbita pepo subsp. pepo TaxID=3664 RepID=UPI000C9D5DEB|nr:uncharacterized protein LOC111805576 [Cucurbita pepo subsp. pepo]
MPPRTRGGGLKGRPPLRGRGRGRGRNGRREDSVEQPVPPPAAPQAAPDPTAALVNALQTVIQNLTANPQAKSPTSTMEASYLRDFKRGDPRTFKGTSEDPTVAQMWLRSIETIFGLTNCPEAHRVECATFMLREDAELWWQATRDIISPEGGAVSWVEFKSAFTEEYYLEDVQLRKQQEFTQLSQRGRSVTTYVREFSKLKRFAPELVNTDYRTARRFVLGLDTKICKTVEAIALATYAVALRAAKSMEGLDSSHETPSSSVGQKRRHAHENELDGKPKCNKCGKNHWGKCLGHIRACFRCGKEDHVAKDCSGGGTKDSKN